MKVALITCGWSSLDGWLGADWSMYDEVVGVNWAGHYFETTWVATWDAICWQYGNMIMPAVGVATIGSPDFLKSERFDHLELEDFRPTQP